MPKKIIIFGDELYDQTKNEFVQGYSGWIEIEHSLSSISEWESKYHKAFISNKDKENEELMDYIKMMTLNKSDDKVYDYLSIQNIMEIKEYMDDPMTATWFPKENNGKEESITSELIYFWMLQSNIPFECNKWHVNKLMALIKVCAIKNAPPKKGTTNDFLRKRAALNAKRCAKHHTKG